MILRTKKSKPRSIEERMKKPKPSSRRKLRRTNPNYPLGLPPRAPIPPRVDRNTRTRSGKLTNLNVQAHQTSQSPAVTNPRERRSRSRHKRLEFPLLQIVLPRLQRLSLVCNARHQLSSSMSIHHVFPKSIQTRQPQGVMEKQQVGRCQMEVARRNSSSVLEVRLLDREQEVLLQVALDLMSEAVLQVLSSKVSHIHLSLPDQ